jgi:HEAT repeat protein
MADREIVKMLTDYMENGFLENIIDMFKHDPSLYDHLPEVMTDERSRVRIGYVNLVETLMGEHGERVLAIVPGIVEHLKDERPQIRADAAYLLEVIGDDRSVSELEVALRNENVEPVREILQDALNVLIARD